MLSPSLPFPYPGSYFLLSAPSFCIPSHPTKLPTFSSTPPYPCLAVSLFSPAFFIASTACVLSWMPDDFQACELVALPIVSWEA